MICKNMKELEKAIMNKINNALETEVFETVREEMTNHIIQDVYDVYTNDDPFHMRPVEYQRRYNDGGLLDPTNIIGTIDGDGGLSVKNVTVGSDYYYNESKGKVMRSQNAGKPIDQVIETGNGYDVHNWEYDGVPRPFVENTINDLKRSKNHIKALKDSLKQQGMDVK